MLNSVRTVRLIDNSIYLQTIVCLTVVYHCCSAILACNYRYLSVILKYKFPNNTKCRHKVVVITVRKKLIQKFRTKLLYLLYYLSKLILDNNYNFDKIYNFSRWWEIMWFEQTTPNFFVNFIPIGSSAVSFFILTVKYNLCLLYDLFPLREDHCESLLPIVKNSRCQ